MKIDIEFRAWPFDLAVWLAAALLAGCGAVGGIVEPDVPADPAEAQIARLTAQGFVLALDGQASGEPTVLRYQGSPATVVTCQSPSRHASATDQSGSVSSPDGRYVVTQTGQVAAYVIVMPSGGLRGIYVNSLVRSIATGDGTVVARQLEKIEFSPGSSARFDNGVTCQPAA